MGQEVIIPDNAVELVKKWEGFHRVDPETGLARPYLCPANVWTIGYGSTRLADGSRVAPDTPPITREQADDLMRLELTRCVSSALALTPTLYGEKLGAIASFIFNLGAGRYKASTLRRKVAEGDWEEAANQIQKWVFAGGRRLPGLVARRKDEAKYLWP